MYTSNDLSRDIRRGRPADDEEEEEELSEDENAGDPLDPFNKYNEVELNSLKTKKSILSSPENYFKCNCPLCLQAVEFKVDGVMKHYVSIDDSDIIHIEGLISNARQGGLILQGYMKVANYFNRISKQKNLLVDSEKEVEYGQMTAEDVELHFTVHRKTHIDILYKGVEHFDALTDDMFKDAPLALESKTVKSKKTKKRRKFYNKDQLLLFKQMWVQKVDLMKVINDFETKSAAVTKKVTTTD